MPTLLKLGPADHGQPLTYDEFITGEYQEGYQYELIEGKLYVAAVPNAPQGLLDQWIYKKLLAYSEGHPKVTNFVYYKSRVFLPSRDVVSAPEPDIAAFHDFPVDQLWSEIDWREVSPVLVIEIASEDDPAKDFVRNVRLYRQVPSIREYWILDNREDADRPTMQVHRRVGRRWRVLNLAFGETYTTRLLPGFKLLLDPHR